MNHISLPASLEAFVEKLPDPSAARRFALRLAEEHPETGARLQHAPEAFSRLLTIAAYSPWLSETLLRRTEFIEWLESHSLDVAPSPDAIREDLAKYARVSDVLDIATLLSRFKRREWIRIYLRDCLHACPLAELIEDLSHVADVILQYALEKSLTDATSQYGSPHVKNERGRQVPAAFSILALGKLGSRELNYASDIDLMFLHSGHGETLGGGRGATSNADFFRKVAEGVLKLVGSQTSPEGPAFRVDVRLRPHGQDGPLVIPLAEATKYYREKAQNWERLAMVRARGAAGDAGLASRFLTSIRSAVFLAEPLADALRDVRLSKEKIDRKQAKRGGGYNVKLGKGGIREIEFIAQALQVCYGGRDPWLRAPQTLIALQRLVEKGYLTKTERSQLADAYTFLRTCEHRVQMEHGAQTHSIPLDEEKSSLLARRLGFFGDRAQHDFFQTLADHRDRVTAVYERVFAETDAVAAPPPIIAPSTPVSPEVALRQTILSLLTRPDSGIAPQPMEVWERWVDEFIHLSHNASQSLFFLRNVIVSWEAGVRDRFNSQESAFSDIPLLSVNALREAGNLCQSGEFFAQRLTQCPQLLAHLENPVFPPFNSHIDPRLIFHKIFSDAGARCQTFTNINAALRRLHMQCILDIGRLDISGALSLRQSNLAQSALAEAVLDSATNFTLRMLQPAGSSFPVWCCIALGRLGHQGLDYGSDLDVMFVYDDDVTVENKAGIQTIRLAETVIGMLSALTAEGTLYRLDLRLRPDGRNGPLAVGKRALLRYITERAATWERLAYLKMRPVAGDCEFGIQVQREVRTAIFDAHAHRPEELRCAVAAMRLRVERERAGQKSPQRNFKFGPGGMMDVYFITRYIQIRDQIPDPPEYGTISLIERLAQLRTLNAEPAEILRAGYAFLRRIDHTLRLYHERPTAQLPSQTHVIAQRLGFQTSAHFDEEYLHRTQLIRAVYQSIFS